LQGILAKRSHDVALAPASWQDHAGVAGVACVEPGIQLVDGALLVGS